MKSFRSFYFLHQQNTENSKHILADSKHADALIDQ
jgi:hypothetical protein